MNLTNKLNSSLLKFYHSTFIIYFCRMHSYTEENYLKALFNLSAEKGEVSPNEVSKQLGIKMPTVNSMMKKLAEKKLVIYESYKPIRLTEKGKKEAGLIIRKHRLTEMFLVQQMGFGWEEVHEIAEQVEHLQSPVFFEKMFCDFIHKHILALCSKYRCHKKLKWIFKIQHKFCVRIFFFKNV